MSVDVEDWGFDSHDRNRATDLDVAYEGIHDLERMAQRELQPHEDEPTMKPHDTDGRDGTI